MNFDFCIFGKKSGLQIIPYLNNINRVNFHNIADGNQEVLQMIVKRVVFSSTLQHVHYVYIKRLNDNDYIGICLRFKNEYCNDTSRLYYLLNTAIQKCLVETKVILKQNGTGKISFDTSITDNFLYYHNEIENLKNYIYRELNSTFCTEPLTDFSNGYSNSKSIFLKDNPTAQSIIDNIKHYDSVIIVPPVHNFVERIMKIKKKYKNYNLYFGILLLILLGIFITRLVLEKCSFWEAFVWDFSIALGVCFVFFEKLSDAKKEIIALFTFIISILGLTLTIDSSIFSQSYKGYTHIIERCFKKENMVDISNSINDKTDTVVNLVLVFDVSKSPLDIQNKYIGKEEAIAKRLYGNVKNKLTTIDSINNKLKTFLWKKGEKQDQYMEYHHYKLKILNIIADIKNQTEKNQIDLVCFADKIHIKKDVNIEKTMNIINNLELDTHIINRDQTNFLNLFDTLIKIYKTEEPKDFTKKPKYTFLFFSDYLHDMGTKDNKTEDSVNISNKLNIFFEQNNFSNYFFVSKNKKLLKENEFYIFPLFKDWTKENSKARLVSIESEEYDFMDLYSDKIIPIFYEHSYRQPNKLSTKITFDSICSENTVNVSLNRNLHNIAVYNQHFTVSNKTNSSIFDFDPVIINLNNPLILSFSGLIIENYPFTTLTIQNTVNHTSTRFDIVFFKDLPSIVRYFIALTIFSFFLITFSLIIFLIKKIMIYFFF